MHGCAYQPSRVCNFSNAIFSETQFQILFNICLYGIHPTMGVLSKYFSGHIKIHTKEKLCGLSELFSRQSTLNLHIKIHTKEKPCRCEICQICFSDPRSRIIHIRTQTKKKPFQSEFCLSRSVRGGHASPWTIHGPFQAHTKVQVWIASIGEWGCPWGSHIDLAYVYVPAFLCVFGTAIGGFSSETTEPKFKNWV